MSQVFGLTPSNPTSIAVATFIQSLAPLNSAANPVIYCLFSANLGKYCRSGESIKLFETNLLYFHPQVSGLCGLAMVLGV